MIEIVEPGPLATVQDLGRPGWAALGVPRSGAFDRAAARLANRLVGNRPEHAVVEMTFGGLVLRALDAATLALTGAACPGADFGTATTVEAGEVVRLGAPVVGVRSYLAVRGGFRAVPVLGSCSTDLLGGLGPEPLRAGARLPVGPPPRTPPSGVLAVGRPDGRPLLIHPGPREAWFSPDALHALTERRWIVRPDSDRIGVRLDGAALRRVRTGELPSEPALPGAVQVPADGRPIIFGPDAPVTGGYPVIAVVADADFDRVAQLRPGDPVRFSRARRAGPPT